MGLIDSLRLTDLHEEAANARELARRHPLAGRLLNRHAGADLGVEAVRFLLPAGPLPRRSACASAIFRGGVPLKHGIPDAERIYQPKRKAAIGWEAEEFKRAVGVARIRSFDHWINHARHVGPVEGCHLCRKEGAL